WFRLWVPLSHRRHRPRGPRLCPNRQRYSEPSSGYTCRATTAIQYRLKSYLSVLEQFDILVSLTNVAQDELPTLPRADNEIGQGPQSKPTLSMLGMQNHVHRAKAATARRYDLGRRQGRERVAAFG